jgi:hypothetical protein
MGRNPNIRKLVVDATFWLEGRKKYVNVFKVATLLAIFFVYISKSSSW